ncbi:hypothetical protein BpHYR1_040784 [Brachionus plicatilis]|uniref:Uncharacterized protein n=1 Tax=Brachionus plicatilis TaxID=10195 RepID=A0A3M7Q181_BRAPC|nr:hypothetical protein BpHYR1_040784 [Brachionus plicatilis]
MNFCLNHNLETFIFLKNQLEKQSILFESTLVSFFNNFKCCWLLSSQNILNDAIELSFFFFERILKIILIILLKFNLNFNKSQF